MAAVAVAELPAGQWQFLVQNLLNKVVANSTEMERESSLEAIGYICQDCPPDVLESQSNHILTAIIHGMRKAETSNQVRLAATTALQNSLEFTRNNFDSPNERNYIMEVVCEATQSPDTQISVAALQCLVKIMSLYYQHMQMYMGQALFPITLEAMRSDNVQVSLQGIEFWSNVCDEEMDLEIEKQEAQETGIPPTRVSQHYARGALEFLAPVLTDKLTKQEEFDDEDDWNPSKAAGVCLMLLATCCETDIVPHVFPFIKENIKSENWRFRDAALMAFGSILGGLDEPTLKPLIEQAMSILVELMYDSNATVRDTAAWTFGRICEIIPRIVIASPYFPKILEALLRGLKEAPRLAANVCWALTGLAEAAYDEVATEDDTPPQTFALTKYFDFMVECLLETTDRTDGAQANLRSAAYEALMELIKNSPLDCYPTVQKTTLVILNRMDQLLHMIMTSGSDLSQINDLQSLLCGTLQSVLRKVNAGDAPKISDPIMNALLTMFNTNSMRSGSVQEDALMAVSVLVELLGDQFLKYMEAFKPFLYMGLKNHQEYQVCCVAVGLTGDICRALKQLMLPYCDEIMTLLVENLSNGALHRSVKPQILSVFGDIALSIGTDFQKYLPVVLQMLMHASQVQVDQNDYDMVEYLNELRESVIESYTGIIQGLKGPEAGKPLPQVAVMESQLPQILKFVAAIAEDKNNTEAIIASAVGLIGDLCSAFGPNLLMHLEHPSIQKLMQEGKQSKQQRTKMMAGWAQKEIKKLQKMQKAQQQGGQQGQQQVMMGGQQNNTPMVNIW